MNYSFEHPIAFFFLVSYFLSLKYLKAKNDSLYFPNMQMLMRASIKSRFLLHLTKFMSIFCLVFALASPVKEDSVVMQNDKGYEISLILDASGSMRSRNKFGVVKDIVQDFINKRVHDKLGLSIFADFAYVAVPLTYDKKSIKSLLSKIEVGIAGTRRTSLNEALFLSSNLFQNSHAKQKIAILLTDGRDNTNAVPLSVAINTAKKYGIKVYTIGVGTIRDYNPTVLKNIANETGGEFFHANSIEGLKNIYEDINKLEKSEIKSDKYIKKTHYFQYFLFFGFLSLMAYFYLAYKE